MNTNYPVQSQLLTLGANNFRNRWVQIIEEVTGKAVQISKTLSFVPAFDVKNVKGLTTVKFFSGTKILSNQPDGYVRPQDKDLIITGIRFFSANDATALGAAQFVNGLDDGNVALNTGFVTIESNGVRYLEKVPLQYFTQVLDQTDSGALMLPIYIPWLGQTELTVTVEFTAAPTATNNVYVGISLEGVGLQ